jgi:hypothetical protein
MNSVCSLCGSSLTPVLDETALWRVWLNVNQKLLGKLVIVLKRHEEQVARLSAAEWLELHAAGSPLWPGRLSSARLTVQVQMPEQTRRG